MTGEPAHILIVDDEPRNVKLLTALLHAEGYRTSAACSGAEALTAVAHNPPDLILLDVMMPGMNGNEVAGILKSDAGTAGIPIVMVSAHSDADARLAGLEAGAEDFLTKPVNRAELWLRVRNLLRLKNLSDTVVDHRDVLEREVLARTADLHQLANFDSLTQLSNRALFHKTLHKTLAIARRQNADVGLLFVDIDHFKEINDSRGHAAGDDLLQQFAGRLTDCVRLSDTVGRLGGDEFGVILLLAKGGGGAAVVATKILEALKRPFQQGGQELTVTASIGITVHPEDASEAETLLQYADAAMYRVKSTGRGTFSFFTAQMNAELQSQLELETALRQAVARGEFVLRYQPKVHLGSGLICGVEALLRWERPGHGLVPPAAFIPTLERTGLIGGVGSWVIDEACRQIGLWSVRSHTTSLPVSVNVSARQFVEGDLAERVAGAIAAHRIPGHLLELELTESMLMANTTGTVATLDALRSFGVRISVDDFGTGYSSLDYLRRFPIDALKIDRAFVNGITTSPNDAAIALSIIRMAHSLKLDVVAEGVENAGQLAYLRRHECDQMQGYLFSEPVTADEVDALLASGARLATDETCGPPAKTVLLFGTQPVGLVALHTLLAGDGYQLLSATSAAQALDLLALQEVGVIICDSPRSDNGGERFLEIVKELHPAALRIVVAGSSDIGSLGRAINAHEIHRYYVDPWNAGVLRADVRDAFRRDETQSVPHESPLLPSSLQPPGPRPAKPRVRRRTRRALGPTGR